MKSINYDRFCDRHPEVSVITPTYNSDEFISETIRSVQNQSFESWEMIIVDDGSTDDTLHSIREIQKSEKRVKLIELSENKGAAVARNVAITASSGRFLAFLDSDDLWYQEKLSVQIDFMKKNDIALSYSSYDLINTSGDDLGSVRVPNTQSYHQLLKRNRIGCLTAIVDKDKVTNIEMPLIRKRQDLGLWLNILRKHKLAYGIDRPLAAYRKRKNSVSSNKISAARYTWKLYREHEEIGFLPACYFFSIYAINGILKM